jgi:hypothetical protein
VYQGGNDRPLLETLRRAYACAHSPLVADAVPHRAVAGREGQTVAGRLADTPAAVHLHRSASLDAALTAPTTPSPPGPLPLPPAKGRKIRVGFVSSHIRRHSICKLFCGLFLHLDRSVFDVVVFAALHESDHDNVTRAVLHHRDAVSGDVDVEAVVVGMTMVKNRDEVVRRRIDVLVFLDVGMQPATVAWSAARLAPVQVHTPNSSPLLRVATLF